MTLRVTFGYNWRSDHLLFCLQTPSSLTDKYTNSEPCLSSSGTLVFPYLAIGGYQHEQYTQGKALILTFVIKNYEDRDSKDFKNALRWEEEFLKLVKAESEKLEFWDLAFYSERQRFQTKIFSQKWSRRRIMKFSPEEISRILKFKMAVILKSKKVNWRRNRRSSKCWFENFYYCLLDYFYLLGDCPGAVWEYQNHTTWHENIIGSIIYFHDFWSCLWIYWFIWLARYTG